MKKKYLEPECVSFAMELMTAMLTLSNDDDEDPDDPEPEDSSWIGSKGNNMFDNPFGDLWGDDVVSP